MARKLGTIGRVVVKQAGRSRTINALMQAGRTTAISMGRVLHLLWLQVTGFVFLCIALVAGTAARHEYVLYRVSGVAPGRAILAGVVTVMFLWFGVSSFWKASRKQ